MDKYYISFDGPFAYMDINCKPVDDPNDEHYEFYLQEQADAQMAKLEAQIPRWVPTSERLPEEEGEFLGGFFDSHMMTQEVLYFQHGNWYLSDESLAKPTHWTRLPDPPE